MTVELVESFASLLGAFAPAFTTSSFENFVMLMTGWVLSHRRRFVTELIQSAGCVGRGHHSRYHRFFSAAKWSLDDLSRILLTMLVNTFVPDGMIILAVDDTLIRRRGLSLFGAGMHYDPLISSRAKKLVSWGHNWVILQLIVPCPWWSPTKVWALPISFRLYINRQGNRKGQKRNKEKPKPDPSHRTRPQLALELIQLVASWFPTRELMIVGDSAYGGKSILRQLPNNVHLICHVAPNGVLYEQAPPRSRGRGAPRKKGARLANMQKWAADDSQPWTPLAFNQFGLHTTLMVKSIQALYYTAGGSRLLTIVLTRDAEGKRPDQRFFCTKLTLKPREILSLYAGRWASEVTFEDSKQLMGFKDPANRTKDAVLRTAPIALILRSLIILWTHQVGHQFITFPVRPWYRKKSEPSFADLLTALRSLSWQKTFSRGRSMDHHTKKFVASIVALFARAA